MQSERSGKQYRHLSAEERAVLMVMLDEKHSLRRIAARLGRAPSTLSRELARTLETRARYDASAGGARAAQLRHQPRSSPKLSLKLTTAIRCVALVACVGLATPAVADPAPTNYCNDQEAAAAWARLLANNPDDTGIQRLAALRAHLCKLVDTGSMTVETATSIFESEREAEVRRRRPSIEDGQPVG